MHISLYLLLRRETDSRLPAGRQHFRPGIKAPSALAISPVSPVSGVSVIWTIWTVVPPVSVIWTVVSPVCGVCVIWTVVPPVSVIPRIVVPPISVVTIPVPIGGAGGKYRRYKKNNQEYQQGFSHCRTPLGPPPIRGVRCFSPLLVKRWGGGGLFNAQTLRVLPLDGGCGRVGGRWKTLPASVAREHVRMPGNEVQGGMHSVSDGIILPVVCLRGITLQPEQHRDGPHGFPRSKSLRSLSDWINATGDKGGGRP